jgi:pimeloyl-ACP methyl ester carboxylesterase
MGHRGAIGSKRYPPDPDRIRALAERCFERGVHASDDARQLAAIIAASDRTALLARLDLPTTVIHGDRDRLVLPSGGRATAAAIPGARLVMVPGMAHGIPDVLWQQIVDEIARNAARANTEPVEERV